MTDYTQITWQEVRKGDVLMHENGDRLTVFDRNSIGDVYVSGVWRDGAVLRKHGFSPYRRKPEVPTVPGAHLDKDGYLWKLTDSGTWPWECGGDVKSARGVAKYAPFTRLVPMPTEEQIRETLFKTDPGTIYGVDAVVVGMKSLLGGGDDA